MRKIILAFALLGGALRIALLFASRDFLVAYQLPDDALYYFTIAKNLSHGLGLSFDGIHPSNGYHPLWLFLITPIFRLGLDPWQSISAVLVFQSVLDVAVIALIGKLIWEWTSANAKQAQMVAVAIGTAAYALSPIMIIRGINGLETTITTLVMLLWLRQFVRAYTIAEPTNRDWIGLGLFSGLLFLARTDMALFMAPSLGALLYKRRENLNPRSVALPVVAGLSMVLPWLLWNEGTFGSMLQSSAGAVPYFALKKYDVMYGAAWKYRYLIEEAIRNMVKPLVYVALGLPIVVGIGLRVSGGKSRDFLPAGVLLPACSMFGLIAFHTIVRGFIRDWYVIEFVGLIAVVMSLLLAGWMDAAKQRARLISSLAFSYLFVALSVQGYLELRAPRNASQCDMVQFGIPFVTGLKSGESVGAFNTGYYGYFAPRPGAVVNLDGVVNAEAIEAIKFGALSSYLAKEHITYLLDFKGDVDGFRGLIDHDLTRDYHRERTLSTRDSSSPLELWRRN